jgi:hypothetical protein
MPETDASAIKGHTAQPDLTDYWGVAARWRMVTYLAAVSPLLLLLVLARLYPDLNETNSPDWKTLISAADKSWAGGDLDGARHLYLKTERAAASLNDWRGLVATACRFHRLGGANGPYSKPVSILIRAATAAELERSRRGMMTVAQSLSLLGRGQAAAGLLARISADWANGISDMDESSLMIEGCFSTTPSTAARQ